jgi:hypothetical protein
MMNIRTLILPAAFALATGLSFVPAFASSGTSLPPAAKTAETVLALSLEQMNCSSSDTNNEIPCAEKGRF